MAFLFTSERFWPVFWASVVIVLGAVVALEHYFGDVDAGKGARAPAKVADAKLLPPFSLPPEAQAAPETTARPLFVPTRRPAPPLAAVAKSTMKRGQFVLTGVTVTPEAAFAFLKEVPGGKTQSVRKGTQVGGLTVDIVEPRRVVLRQGEETEELALNVQVPSRVVAAPAPSTATPPAPGAVPAPGGMPPPGAKPQIPGFPQPTLPGAGAPAAAAAPQAAPGTPAASAPVSGRRRPWITQ
jgi:hypothetical protein